MQTGLHDISGEKHYFDKDGKSLKGFQKIDGKTYFFSRVGTNPMKTGFFSIDGIYYYFDENGVMQTGLQDINGEKHYFDKDGKSLKGFQKIDGKTYFFSRVGTNPMKYGWQLVDNYFYYFNINDGSMVTTSITIKDKKYDFKSDGVVKLTGWNNINGARYYFNAGDKVLGNVEKLVIDVSYHQGEIDWNKVANSGIYRVILRIGYYKTEDERFSEYIKEVKRLGIPYGIYLYSYSSTTNGANIEADLTKSMISKYNLNPTLGIYYDIEHWSTSSEDSYNISKSQYDNIIGTYINNVSSYVGAKYKVKVYTYTNYANNYLGDHARSQIDWIADYRSSCGYKGNYSLWQYTSEATLDGIRGFVDMSYLY